MPNKIIGFSKLSRAEKIDWLKKNILDNSHQVKLILDKYLNSNKDIQAIHDSFSENSISNFYLPYSVSPNFLINDKIQINKEEQTAQESSVIKNTISHKEEIQSAFDSPQEQVNKNKSEPNEEFSGNRRMRRLQAKAKRKKRK